MWTTALIVSAMALALSGCSSASVSRDRDECLDIATEQEAEIGRLTLELQRERAGSGYWQSLYRQAVLMKSQAEGRQAVAEASAGHARADASASSSRNRGHVMQDFFRQQEIDKLERRLEEVEAR